MLRTVFAILALLPLASAAAGPAPAADRPARGAPPAAPAPPTDRAGIARVQSLLARANFSPGLIDGKSGRKTRIALEHFQRARGLPITGEADAPTLRALADAAPGAWTRSRTITREDLALITGPIPEDWNERAALDLSGYIDLSDLLAERGWCSLDFLQVLNPGVDLTDLDAGDTVTLPITDAAALPELSRVTIDLTEKLVIGYDGAGAPVFLAHCSIARDVEKRPVGRLHVKVIATDPDYTFDPENWPEVDNVESKLRIPPGPRNPVGLAWIGLDKPGYGLHGTVRPQDIGKTGSHGCFRMANWDAVRLAHAVEVGTPVDVRE